jgi:hypothetical protein
MLFSRYSSLNNPEPKIVISSYEIKPKILFVNELGKYRSYHFEPQSIEVKELGFMGWAKGKQ